MYMRDFNLMVDYAYAIRESNELSNKNIDQILGLMEDHGIYRPRNGGSTYTGQFKSIQIAWYMFGYYNKSREKGEVKKMVFTPLGNLLLDNRSDRVKTSKIFLTMLFGNGFHQPFSKMDERFNLYPFRLIFQLLRDPRLNGRLYNDEVFYYTMFMKTVNHDSYEALVSDILSFRELSPYQKLDLFKKDERVVGLALHEWNYAVGLFESAGIVKKCNDHDNRIIGELTYGKTSPKTGRPNAVRHYKEDYIILEDNDIISLIDKLLANYPFDAKPYSDEDLAEKFSSAIVVEMYSFYPPELLEELGMNTKEDKAIAKMLEKANNINYYSHCETEGGAKFEYALADAYNMFSNVEAERIGNASNVDVECLYSQNTFTKKKFDIEAKARETKLIEVNSKRILNHRNKINSKYTMIVTPNFVDGVLQDIKGERSVICKSATLANYFYQYILKNGRSLSYFDLDQIIEQNLGNDITEIVNNYVYNNFGHEAPDN